MSTTPKNGGPAFPACGEAWTNDTMGMTLRDWFAGQALSGMMANSYYHESGIVPIKDCYHFADAMIAEREKGGSNE
jgi:hypothetical protein